MLKVTVEARINSITKSTHPEKLSLELRCQENLLQATVDSSIIGREQWLEVQELNPESIVRVAGHLHAISNESRTNGHTNGLKGYKAISKISYDLSIEELTIIARADPSLPSFQDDAPSLSNLDSRLNNRIMSVRHAAAGAIFKLHSGMCQLIVEYLCTKGFHWVHTPRIINATITGDQEYFHLPYFGKDSWLAQSTQHHKQMALSMDMERVFEIGPVFRAEVKSGASARHMTEFTVLDIGMVFEDDYHEVVELIESMLLYVFRGLQERKQYARHLKAIQEFYPSAGQFRIGLDEDGKIPRISFLEAKRILREEIGVASDDHKNFTDKEEALLGQHFLSSPHHGRTSIFTIDQYPASMRQFNSQGNPKQPLLSNTWDTLVGGREICSGSQRINGYDDLCHAMRNNPCGAPLDPDEKKWEAYMTAFKTGMPRHGGCGLGVNRLLQGFLGLDDVREVTLFPRDVKRLSP